MTFTPNQPPTSCILVTTVILHSMQVQLPISYACRRCIESDTLKIGLSSPFQYAIMPMQCIWQSIGIHVHVPLHKCFCYWAHGSYLPLTSLLSLPFLLVDVLASHCTHMTFCAASPIRKSLEWGHWWTVKSYLCVYFPTPQKKTFHYEDFLCQRRWICLYRICWTSPLCA